MNEQHYYGFAKEPFAQDLRVEDLNPAPYLAATTERILYAIRLSSRLPSHRGGGLGQIDGTPVRNQ